MADNKLVIRVEAKADKADAQLKKLDKTVDRNTRSTKTLTRAQKAGVAVTSSFTAATSSLAAAHATAATSANAFAAATSRVNAAAGIATTAIKGLAAPLLLLFGAAKLISGAADFENQLLKIKTTTTFTQAELEKLSAEASRISRAHTTSLEEVLRNIGLVVERAPLYKKTLEDVIGASDLVTQASTMLRDETDTTANSLIKIALAYGSTIPELEKVTNVIGNLRKENALTIESFKLISDVAAPASQVGISFSELATIFTIAAESGFKMRQVASALRPAFSRLAMEGATLNEVLANGVTEQEALRFGMSSNLTLFEALAEEYENNSDRLQEMTAAMEDAANKNKIMEEINESGTGAWSSLTTEIENFTKSLLVLEPVFVGTLEFLTQFVELLGTVPRIFAEWGRISKEFMDNFPSEITRGENFRATDRGREGDPLELTKSDQTMAGIDYLRMADQEFEEITESAAAAKVQVDEITASTQELTTSVTQLQQAWKSNTEAIDVVGKGLSSAFTMISLGFTSATLTVESFGRTFLRIGQQISAQLLKMSAIQLLLSSPFGTLPAVAALGRASGFGLIQARAEGGEVKRGTPYLVGERGMELFVPKQSGQIVPNNQLNSPTVNITINEVPESVDKEELAENIAIRVLNRLDAG